MRTCHLHTLQLANQLCVWDQQVVFRCDMLPLAGLIVLHMLLTKRITWWQTTTWTLAAVAGSALLTVSVDSVLWRRLLWPEGEVLWFNSVLNKCALVLCPISQFFP